MKNLRRAGMGCVIIALCSISFRPPDGHNNTSVRFVGKTAYAVLDSADFYLYELYQPVQINKGKTLVMEEDYFFSKDRNSGVMPLTIQNVENAFASNTTFRYLLEAEFHRNTDLIAYDPFLKEYKIKYLYERSLNSK
jgi:hypothetical protein